jgi:hypothetical protein
VNCCLKQSEFATRDKRTEIEHSHKLLPQLNPKEIKALPKVLDNDDVDIRIQLEYNVVHLPEDLKSVEEDYMLLLQTNPIHSSEYMNAFQKQSKSCDNPCDDSDTYRCRRRSVKKTKRNSVHTDNE